ncbi:hypothetical protein SLA2020_475060 [Shorea laevis]
MARRYTDTGSSTVLDEDFQPKSEEKDEGAHLLLVYLPGFTKDQIQVTYEHPMRSVRVQGERSLGNNKWSRFNRTFPVSQNCIAEGIHGVFQDGILTITIRKQTTSPPQHTASFSKGAGMPFQPAAVEGSHVNISLRDSIEKSNSTSQKPITESRGQKGQVQTDTSAKETPKQSIQSDDGNAKGEEKRVDATIHIKYPYETILQKQDETPLVKETEKTIEKKKGHEIRTVLEEEDRQLIVNMAVAVLTIMALGAYVTYST